MKCDLKLIEVPIPIILCKDDSEKPSWSREEIDQDRLTAGRKFGGWHTPE